MMNGTKMLKSTALAAGVVATALGSVMTATPAAAQTTMKIAHVVPQGDPRDTAARHVADLIKESDACDLEVQVFPSGQLGSTTDLIEGMQIGSIEAVLLPGSFLVGFQPIMGLMDFPYFWPSDLEELQALHKSDAVRRMLDSTDSQGVYSMDIWHTGYKQWTANSPLAEPDDYAGKSARVMPSPILVEQQTALGLTPVDMPFGETYNALQSGAIDAQENPITTSYVMAFHEVQSHLTMTNHGNLDQVFMVSKAWFEGLSDACQQALEEAVDSGAQVAVDETLKLEEKGLAAMKEAGLTVVEPTEAQLDALREATLPAVRARYLELTGDPGRAVLEAVEAEINN